MNRKRAGCFLFLLRILGYGVSIKLNVNNDKSTTYLRSRNQNSRFFSWLRFGYSICPIFDFQRGIHLSWYNKKISPKLLTLRILSSTFLFQSFFVSGAYGNTSAGRALHLCGTPLPDRQGKLQPEVYPQVESRIAGTEVTLYRPAAVEPFLIIHL